MGKPKLVLEMQRLQINMNDSILGSSKVMEPSKPPKASLQRWKEAVFVICLLVSTILAGCAIVLAMGALMTLVAGSFLYATAYAITRSAWLGGTAVAWPAAALWAAGGLQLLALLVKPWLARRVESLLTRSIDVVEAFSQAGNLYFAAAFLVMTCGWWAGLLVHPLMVVAATWLLLCGLVVTDIVVARAP